MSIRALVLAVVVALPASAAITPYDARYDLELTMASSTTGPRALDGILEYRVARACSGGWETRSRVMLNAVFRDDTTSANERIFTSWESDDGTQYRFAVQTSKNGVMVESVKGNAKIGKKGGEATYEATAENGQKIKVPLPRDTFLPVAYQEAVLNRAARGEVLFSGVVLNGSSTDGPRVLSTSIGPRESDFKAAGTPGSSVDPQLLGAGWPMSLAFFRLFEKSDSPIFETAMHQHESGVADEIRQTFSDFAISAHLARLKRVPKSDCARS